MIGDGDENAKAAGIRVLRGHVVTTPELLRTLGEIRYRSAPGWLGGFGLAAFGQLDGRRWVEPPSLVEAEHRKLASLVPGQEWTTAFVQKYRPGQAVLPHRDPRNNVGHTVIGLYGDFSPTRLRVGDYLFVQRPGDVFVLPCTIDGQQGPFHEMWWESGLVLPRGIRYAIILNTIRP